MPEEIQVPEPGNRTVVETTEVRGALPVTHTEAATHNYRAVQVTWFLTSLVATLVAIRFVLKLLGASTGSGFVSLVYTLTDALVAPFRAMFPAAAGHSSTVDIAALVALAIYPLIGWGVVALVKLVSTPRGARSVS
jgi:uncharacterized protein YggT (Ycf19 family)